MLLSDSQDVNNRKDTKCMNVCVVNRDRKIAHPKLSVSSKWTDTLWTSLVAPTGLSLLKKVAVFLEHDHHESGVKLVCDVILQNETYFLLLEINKRLLH